MLLSALLPKMSQASTSYLSRFSLLRRMSKDKRRVHRRTTEPYLAVAAQSLPAALLLVDISTTSGSAAIGMAGYRLPTTKGLATACHSSSSHRSSGLNKQNGRKTPVLKTAPNAFDHVYPLFVATATVDLRAIGEPNVNCGRRNID